MAANPFDEFRMKVGYNSGLDVGLGTLEPIQEEAVMAEKFAQATDRDIIEDMLSDDEVAACLIVIDELPLGKAAELDV